MLLFLFLAEFAILRQAAKSLGQGQIIFVNGMGPGFQPPGQLGQQRRAGVQPGILAPVCQPAQTVCRCGACGIQARPQQIGQGLLDLLQKFLHGCTSHSVKTSMG